MQNGKWKLVAEWCIYKPNKLCPAIMLPVLFTVLWGEKYILMVSKSQLRGNFECLSSSAIFFRCSFFLLFCSVPFFRNFFAYAAIFHRNYAKKSNLNVCEIHENTICAAYSKIMIRQKVIYGCCWCVSVCVGWLVGFHAFMCVFLWFFGLRVHV